MQLVRNIKQVCKERNMTLAEVERAAGVSKRSIYRWDEKIPAYTKVLAVANVLQVPVEELCREGGH